MSIKSPPKQLQRIAGINLTSNIHLQEVAQAKKLLGELIEGDGRANIVYYCGIQPRVRAFEAVLDWDRIVNGSKGNTIPALPINWVTEHAYRLDLLRQARFIVFETVNNYEQLLASTKKVDTFDQEQLVVCAWLNSLGEKDGVRIHSESTLRLLEVIDINAFDNAATKLYYKYKWRKAFIDGYKARWITEQEVAQIAPTLLKEKIPLRFEGNEVASIVGVEVSRDGNDMIITIYINHTKSLHQESGLEPWFVFVQLLNGDGSVQATVNQPFSTGSPPFDRGNIRKYELRFKGQASGRSLVGATGIFSPQAKGHVYLLSPNGEWNGMRNRFTIPAL